MEGLLWLKQKQKQKQKLKTNFVAERPLVLEEENTERTEGYIQ